MGLVYADITISNLIDVGLERRGFLKKPEIRQTTVTAMVDTGAATIIIDEDTRQKLGLEIVGDKGAELADGTKHRYAITEPVEIQWKDRTAVCYAMVVPGSNDVLLGAIPLEIMDLIIHPSKQELTGAHGDEIVYRV